jgi:transposase
LLIGTRRDSNGFLEPARFRHVDADYPTGAYPHRHAIPTDLTDAEWRVTTGRPRTWPMREIVNGIFYIMRAGCPWRLPPNDLPPWGTIYRWFAVWRNDGRFER